MRIREIFLSLQGEGKDSGLPTVFIRTAKCNLKCSFCDTSFANGKEMKVKDIVKEVRRYGVNRVCITGGEPLIEKEMLILVVELKNHCMEISIETNGTINIEPYYGLCQINMDIKTPVSNMVHHTKWDNIQFLDGSDQVKFIIGTKNDYDYAKKVMKTYPICAEVVLQPVWSKGFGMARHIAKWMLADGLEARLSLQTHKLLKVR